MCAIVYTYVYTMTHIQGSVLFYVSKLRHVEQHTPSMVVYDHSSLWSHTTITVPHGVLAYVNFETNTLCYWRASAILITKHIEASCCLTSELLRFPNTMAATKSMF